MAVHIEVSQRLIMTNPTQLALFSSLGDGSGVGCHDGVVFEANMAGTGTRVGLV